MVHLGDGGADNGPDCPDDGHCGRAAGDRRGRSWGRQPAGGPSAGHDRGTPAQVADAKANRPIYNNSAGEFDLRHVRNIATFGGTYNASKAFDIDAMFTSTGRKGEQPWGASFAFNNAIELAKSIDERTNDLNLGVTWGGDKGT